MRVRVPCRSPIRPDNERSIRLAERLGERFEREVALRGRTVRLYSVARTD